MCQPDVVKLQRPVQVPNGDRMGRKSGTCVPEAAEVIAVTRPNGKPPGNAATALTRKFSSRAISEMQYGR